MILKLIIIAVVTIVACLLVDRWVEFTWKRWLLLAIIVVGVVLLLSTAGIIPALW